MNRVTFNSIFKRIFDEWGYPNIVFSDSAGCYTGGDYENFLDKHGIKSLHPSAKHPSSNPAEPGVKNIKRLAQKSQNELDFADKLAKFRRCPRADGFSPAFMMLDREPRDPFLPTLPQNEVKISKAFQQRLLTKIKRSSKTENRKSLSELEIGTLVLLQCPISKMWSQTGEILSKDDISGRSYWVKRHGHKKLNSVWNRHCSGSSDLTHFMFQCFIKQDSSNLTDPDTTKAEQVLSRVSRWNHEPQLSHFALSQL